ERGRGVRALDPRRHDGAAGGAGKRDHRAPAVHHPERGPDPRAPSWARAGGGASRRADGGGRRVRAAVRDAVRTGAGMKAFHAAVYRLVRRVPRGRVVTYGQVATLLGYPRAARAVGQAMRHCPPSLPWHRVVNARGGISVRGNVGSMLTQRILLEQEG